MTANVDLGCCEDFPKQVEGVDEEILSSGDGSDIG